MSVEEHIFLARVAEQAERFDDMVDFLKPVLDQKGGDITSDERNLLSVAFKNLISSKRTAWRTISAIEQNPKYQKFADSLGNYKRQIENALYKDCENIIAIIQTKVLSKTVENEAKAFFVKMVGDYYRYIAETAQNEKLEQVKQEALKAYTQANTIALPPCNPIKLGLALNFSVFHYEVMKDHKQACILADEALQQALEKIDDLGEDDFRDAKSIIELLKENLTLWKEEEEGEGGVEDL
jgi:14-3-3 protein